MFLTLCANFAILIGTGIIGTFRTLDPETFLTLHFPKFYFLKIEDRYKLSFIFKKSCYNL